jgi:hypothetical protein
MTARIMVFLSDRAGYSSLLIVLGAFLLAALYAELPRKVFVTFAIVLIDGDRISGLLLEIGTPPLVADWLPKNTLETAAANGLSACLRSNRGESGAWKENDSPVFVREEISG